MKDEVKGKTEIKSTGGNGFVGIKSSGTGIEDATKVVEPTPIEELYIESNKDTDIDKSDLQPIVKRLQVRLIYAEKRAVAQDILNKFLETLDAYAVKDISLNLQGSEFMIMVTYYTVQE